MTEKEPGENRSLYVRELRLSLRNNAGAYGFSVMITGVFAVLSAIYSSPDVTEIFLFLVGAVVSFATIEVVATRGFRRSLAEREATQVVALGSSLGLVSLSIAVGAAALAGLVVPEPTSWPVGSFVGSSAYLLVTAAEMAVARRIEEARDLATSRQS